MANRKSSWRARRWKTFKKLYAANPDLRTELHKFRDEFDYNIPEWQMGVAKLNQIMLDYDIPIYCLGAILAFLDNPNLKDEEYQEFIMPPFFYWNAVSEKMGPDLSATPANHLKNTLRLAKMNSATADKIAIDTNKTDFRALARLIASNMTILQIHPHVTKTELHELIDDYWDKLEPLINQRTVAGDVLITDALHGKVREPQLDKLKERNQLIVNLSAAGLKDAEIATILIDNGFGALELNYIKQIRYRLRHKKQQ